MKKKNGEKKIYSPGLGFRSVKDVWRQLRYNTGGRLRRFAPAFCRNGVWGEIVCTEIMSEI